MTSNHKIDDKRPGTRRVRSVRKAQAVTPPAATNAAMPQRGAEFDALAKFDAARREALTFAACNLEQVRTACADLDAAIAKGNVPEGFLNRDTDLTAEIADLAKIALRTLVDHLRTRQERALGLSIAAASHIDDLGTNVLATTIRGLGDLLAAARNASDK